MDRVIALQFDHTGIRVRRKAQSLLDSEHVRLAIGEVLPHLSPRHTHTHTDLTKPC